MKERSSKGRQGHRGRIRWRARGEGYKEWREGVKSVEGSKVDG